jgi:8-oxo-dGTP pyrophosphatase MutT (NUDIX family)
MPACRQRYRSINPMPKQATAVTMPRPPKIIDPHAVPVVGVDSHLAPVAIDRLSASALRSRFRDPPNWSPEMRGDGRLLDDRKVAHAAVLIALVEHEDGLRVLLTRRTDHLRNHPGQISFPGGRTDGDDAHAVATALREAEEEVGLDPAQVEVLGELPTYTTVTHFVVTPVVALVAAGYSSTLDAFEVAEAFEVPLRFLMTPANHQRHETVVDGVRRQFFSMPWDGIGSTDTQRHFFIWGATAAMLRNLYRFLAA